VSTKPLPTVTLFGATDRTGRRYLTDRRESLPAEAGTITEFQVAPEQVEWAILQVELEEIRHLSVTIHVGDYAYETPR
jgi:hypothetical protein